jgi:hypothetical protein
MAIFLSMNLLPLGTPSAEARSRGQDTGGKREKARCEPEPRRPTVLSDDVLDAVDLTEDGDDVTKAVRATKTNAALLYWQAFALMPKTPNKQLALLDLGPKEQPTDEHRKLVSEYKHALEMLRRGSAIRSCEWGVQVEQDLIETHTPHYFPARRIMDVACLRAQVRFAAGDGKGAVDDLTDAMILGRTLSRDHLIAGLGFDASMEAQALDVLEANLATLDNELREHVRSRLASLPPRPTFVMFVQKETRITLKALVQDAQIQAAKAGNASKGIEKFVTKCEEMEKMAQRLVKICSERDETTAERIEAYEAELKASSNPLVKLLPSAGALYRGIVTSENRLEQVMAKLER